MLCLSMQMLEERRIGDTLGCFDSRILELTYVFVCVCVRGSLHISTCTACIRVFWALEVVMAGLFGNIFFYKL